MKKYILILCALFAFHTNAEDSGDKFRNVQEHGSWVSGDYNADGEIHTRIINLRSDDRDFLGMYLEFLPNRTYLAEIIASKRDKTPSKLPSSGVDLACDLRVDKGHVYKINCKMFEETEVIRILLMRGLETDFLKDCTKGKTLRVKASLDKESVVYFNFDLKGFSEAHKRASERLHYTDSSYTSPDAAYFD